MLSRRTMLSNIKSEAVGSWEEASTLSERNPRYPDRAYYGNKPRPLPRMN